MLTRTRLQQAEQHNAAIQATTQAIHAQTVRLVDAQMQDVDVQMRALDEFVTRARSQNEAHYTQFVSNLSGLTETVRSCYAHLETEVFTLKDEAESFGAEVAAETTALKDILSPLAAATIAPLSELRRAIEAAPLKEYAPTGATPRKREYDYPRTLPRTLSREELLAGVAAGRPIHQRKHSRQPLGEKEVHSPNKTISDPHYTNAKAVVAQTERANSMPAPAGYHKIFFGTNIGGLVGPGIGKFASDAPAEELENEEAEEEEEGPPLKRTRSQSAKLGVAKGGYSNPPGCGNSGIGKKRAR